MKLFQRRLRLVLLKRASATLAFLGMLTGIVHCAPGLATNNETGTSTAGASNLGSCDSDSDVKYICGWERDQGLNNSVSNPGRKYKCVDDHWVIDNNGDDSSNKCWQCGDVGRDTTLLWDYARERQCKGSDGTVPAPL